MKSSRITEDHVQQGIVQFDTKSIVCKGLPILQNDFEFNTFFSFQITLYEAQVNNHNLIKA